MGVKGRDPRFGSALLGPLLALAGCGTEAAVELEVDAVVYRGGGVVVYPREVARPCTCTNEEFPGPGECVEFSDVIGCRCDPLPATCLSSVTLARGGETVSSVGPSERYRGSYWLELAGDLAGVELVLEGCGGTARVPLTTAVAPMATIDEITVVDRALHVAWSATGEGTGIQVLGNAFQGFQCHEPFVSPAAVSLHGTGRGAHIYLSTLADGAPRATPLGAVRMWAGSLADDGGWVEWP